MAASHAWIFQATPRSRDLTAELAATDTLAWAVRRYGRDLRRGDRVYYWQAGRDAGVYGVGAVDSVSTLGPDGKITVQTRHERALFAPITRAELRADPELRALAVLRQPRGTVFPLTPAQDVALARRTGTTTLTIAVPRERLARSTVRLSAADDGDLLAQVEAARAREYEVIVLVMEAGALVEQLRVTALRRRRDGDLALRIEPLAPADASGSQPDAGLPVERAMVIPTLPVPAVASPEARVAETGIPYAPAPRFAPPPDELRGSLVLPESLPAQFAAAIESGRHVVLMGAPGTGKTALALNVARAAERAGLCAGHLVATATADWTTFDTVGGLVPAPDGALRFAEGIALRALREDRWLILDELNRADIDKAFGPLLTVLSGGPVDLPTVTVAGRPVRVEPGIGPSGLSGDDATYRMGDRWRIVATMNTLDRAALFSFSLAFARRFAFLLVPPPERGEMLALLRDRTALGERAMAVLERVLDAAPRPLGPAILLDAAGYLAARGGSGAEDGPSGDALAEALGAFVLPQLEGLDRPALDRFAEALAPLLGPAGSAALRAYVAAFYGEL